MDGQPVLRSRRPWRSGRGVSAATPHLRSGNAPGAVLTFFESATGEILGTLDLGPWVFDPAVDRELRVSTMTPDGKTMLSVYPSGRAVEIDVASRTVAGTIDPDPDGTGGVTPAKFSPDGGLLAMAKRPSNS